MTQYVVELTGSVAVSDLTNWVCSSTKTVGVGTSTCQDFAQSSYGPFGGTTQTGRTITGIPPHNRVIFNLSVLMAWTSTTFSASETVTTKIDGSVADTLTFTSFGGQTTSNEFVSWSNITQTLDTVSINVIPNLSGTYTDHYVYIRNFRLWYTPCHKTCAVCLSTDINICATCPLFATASGSLCVCNSGYYLYMNTCITTCPSGYSTDTVAAECTLNVLNCATPASLSTCSACNPGYYLNVLDQLCYSSCPQGLETVGNDWSAGVSIIVSFSNGSSYTITSGSCSSTSYLCGTPSVPDCVYTLDKTELDSASSLTFTIQSSVAYNTAAQSFGFNNLHVDIENCSTNCLVCDSTGCLTCSSTTYLYPVDKLCYAVCPAGYYGDSATMTCVVCALQCATCLTTSTNCLTCAGNRTQPPTCSCPDGSFSAGGVSVTCSTCFYKCATCSGSSTNCTTCAAKRDATTIPACTCVANTYDVYGTPSCQDCFNVCSACTGPNQTNCTACKSATRDPANYCNCLTHYYGPITNQDCSICNITCQNCTAGTSSDCTSCPSGSAPANTLARVLSGGKCVCPVGSYDDGSAYCPVCNYRCAQCTGATYSSTDCQVCQTGRDITNNCACITGFDVPGVAACAACPIQCGTCTSAGVCLTCSSTHRTNLPSCTCTTGYYENYTTACGTCNPICLTCTNASTCTSCQPGRDAPNCTCSQGTYSNSSNVCVACHQNCASCYGGGSTQCIQCSPNRTIPPTCTCPDGYFQVSGQVRCPKCDSSCLTCNASGSSACTSCDTSIRVLYGTKCVCKANLYTNSYGDCVSCGAHCATCATDGTCQVCAGNRVGTACNCPSGTYDSGADTCPSCSSTCSECSGSASNCTVCASNRTTAPVCSCSLNAYLPTANPTECDLCSVKCATCQYTADTCLTCNGNRYYVSSTNDCLCPSYTYEDLASTICPSCYRSCKSCSGGTDAECISCRDTYSMNSVGKCVCSSNYYEDVTNKQCRACDSSCAACTGSGSSACTACSTGYQWVNGVCILNGSGSCSALCSACNSSYQCTGCVDSTRELVSGSCLCLGGTYDSNLKCYDCDSSCKQCSGPSSTQCTYCRSGYSLVSGSCQADVTEQQSTSVMAIILIVFGCLFFCVALAVAYRAISKYLSKKKLEGYKNTQQFEEEEASQSRNFEEQYQSRLEQNRRFFQASRR